MNSRKAHIAFFLFGLTAFGFLVARFGVDRIAGNIGRAGWSLLYVTAVWLGIYLLNAGAWKLLIGRRGNPGDGGAARDPEQGAPPPIPFLRLFTVTVTGFVINYVTPFVALGGEPYKVSALSGALGGERALSAVVLYRMVHLLGHMLLLLAGIIVALAALALPPAAQLLLVLAGLLVTAVILFTAIGHRDGIFGRLGRLAARLPLPARAEERLSRFLDASRHRLDEMDATITALYNEARWRIVVAVALEFASRLLMGVEVWLIMTGIGEPATLASALFIYVAYSVVINLFFFIPLSVGSREGGLALGLGALALPPLLGVYLGVVMRIREFVWILIGLSFMLPSLARRSRPLSVPR